MKKRFAVLCGTMLLAGALTACGGDTAETTAAPRPIPTMWRPELHLKQRLLLRSPSPQRTLPCSTSASRTQRAM